MARNEAWGQRMCGQYSNDQFDAYFFPVLLNYHSLTDGVIMEIFLFVHCQLCGPSTFLCVLN